VKKPYRNGSLVMLLNGFWGRSLRFCQQRETKERMVEEDTGRICGMFRRVRYAPGRGENDKGEQR